MKKLVSILLTLVVLVCSLPIVYVSASSVSQDGMYAFDIIDGSYAKITAYKGSQSSITIPSTIKLNDYISYPVKSIGVEAFMDSSIRNVTISYGIQTIEKYAFCGCYELRYISIPNSIKTIGGGAFERCDITKVDYIGSVEDWCNVLFDGYNSSPVMDYSFYVNDENWINYIEGTTDVYFNGTLINSDLIIPDNVSAINDYSFKNFNFTSVTIPGSVESIGKDAFYNCESLKKCFINEGLKNIESGAFSYCDNLELITLPKSFDNNNVDEGEEGLFEDDNKLIIHGYSDSYVKQYALEWGIPFLEHSFTVDTGENIEPTCTKPGGKVLKCSYCEEKLLNIPALGHNFGNWYNTVNPTCTSTGISERVCSRCNLKEGKILPKLAHKTVTVKAKKVTYFESGYTGDKKCKVCNKIISKGKTIAKLKLKAPTIKKINGKNGSKKITFSKVKDASYYEIWDYQYIYYENYARTYKWKKYKTIKSTSCSLRDWKERAYYSYVSVRAVAKKGNKKVYSEFSKIKKY